MTGLGWTVAALFAGLLGSLIPQQSSWDNHADEACAVGSDR